MDKLTYTTKPEQSFKFRSGYLHAAHLCCNSVKLPNLKLKTWLKQLLGSLPLYIALSDDAKKPWQGQTLCCFCLSTSDI
jgi:hypothetical protein